MRTPNRKKIYYWTEFAFLMFGFLCLGWVGYEWVRTQLYQREENTSLEQSLKREGRTERQPLDPSIVGRIEIPRLNLTAMVREGVDGETLGLAVGHVPYSALPGHAGNVAVAAHRDTFFRPVRGIRKGDLIRMVTESGTFEYEVESTKVVMPSNVEVLNATAERSITLVTCYPFNYVGAAPKRFIVRARQISATHPEA